MLIYFYLLEKTAWDALRIKHIEQYCHESDLR